MQYNDQMEIEIRSHIVEVEDDCMIIRLHGEFTLSDMKEWCLIADRVVAKHGHVFTISDFRHGVIFSLEARRYANRWPNSVCVQGTAIFGASFATSVFITMMGRATLVLQKHAIPIVALKTEAEARAWVKERQQKLKLK